VVLGGYEVRDLGSFTATCQRNGTFLEQKMIREGGCLDAWGAGVPTASAFQQHWAEFDQGLRRKRGRSGIREGKGGSVRSEA